MLGASPPPSRYQPTPPARTALLWTKLVPGSSLWAATRSSKSVRRDQSVPCSWYLVRNSLELNSDMSRGHRPGSFCFVCLPQRRPWPKCRARIVVRVRRNLILWLTTYRSTPHRWHDLTNATLLCLYPPDTGVLANQLPLSSNRSRPGRMGGSTQHPNGRENITYTFMVRRVLGNQPNQPPRKKQR